MEISKIRLKLVEELVLGRLTAVALAHKVLASGCYLLD
jgi:hypothetical protein